MTGDYIQNMAGDYIQNMTGNYELNLTGNDSGVGIPERQFNEGDVEQKMAYYSYLILWFLHMYVKPSLAVIGLLGNGACGLILLSSSAMRRVGDQVVFLTSCVCADWVFLMSVLCSWFSTGPGLFKLNIHWCYLFSMLTNGSRLISMWSGVALVVYAFLTATSSSSTSSFASYVPSSPASSNRSSSSSSVGTSVTTARAIVLGITVAAVIISVNLTITVDSLGKDGFCHTVPTYIMAQHRYHQVDLIINAIIPNITITILIIIICKSLYDNRAWGDDYSLSADASYVTPTTSRINISDDESNNDATTADEEDVTVNQTNVEDLEHAVNLRPRQDLSATRSVCLIYIIVICLSIPNLVVRVRLSIKQLQNPQVMLGHLEICIENICHVLLLSTYAIKGYVLVFVWRKYRGLLRNALDIVLHKVF